MNYGNRFAWHMLMPCVFFAFWLEIRNTDLNKIKVSIPILFVTAFMINFTGLHNLLFYSPNAIKSHRAIGLTLSKYHKYNPTIAVGDAGMIPYYSGLNTIDYVGLANSEIALATYKKTEPNLPAPDIFIAFSNIEGNCKPTFPQSIGEQALRKFISEEGYACIPGPRWGNHYYLNFLVNRNFEAYSSLALDIADIKSKSNGISNIEQIKDVLSFSGLR